MESNNSSLNVLVKRQMNAINAEIQRYKYEESMQKSPVFTICSFSS